MPSPPAFETAALSARNLGYRRLEDRLFNPQQVAYRRAHQVRPLRDL
jgi:hypothetical protein